MKIKSATFERGLKGDDDALHNGLPQIAFLGRSNVGKSSLINSLTGVKNLARTSSFPGLTQQLNVFKINNTHYFVDLPGYGFAQVGQKKLDKLNGLIYWYLFDSAHNPKVVLIIDAEIGPTKDDIRVLQYLRDAGKEIIVVANKVDKIKKSHYKNQMKNISEQIVGHQIIPYSSESKIGIKELAQISLARA